MKKAEREIVALAISYLDNGFEAAGIEYNFSDVRLAHRALRQLDLSPPKPREMKS